ncbi:MAG TPA: metal ABC transporter ATP-binding protein [Candidatus Bathyarchaeia archaeon]|nr:metal ABC transporter ATP-binding protein [Candidatus Bathyarchaeia archaeon]
MITTRTEAVTAKIDAIPAITADNLSAGYPDKTVWRNANFKINRGEFVAVIGPNGAGKTTLFRLLLGLQQPLSGSIKIFNSRPRRGNSQIGYVPQRHTIDDDVKVECIELVQLAVSANRWGLTLFSNKEHKIALKTLQAVGTLELAHRSLGDLSGGELQRIFLAEALVSNPEVLLLDEPLSNLDIRRGRDLVQLIDSVVRKRNVTAFLVAHDINPLLPFLDNVIYIANGKVATGKPKEVLTSECLSALYEIPIEVLHDSKGNIAIIGSGADTDKEMDLLGSNRCTPCGDEEEERKK